MLKNLINFFVFIVVLLITFWLIIVQMNRWYRYMGTMVNLDSCSFICSEYDNCFQIEFYNSQGVMFHSFGFSTKEHLMETYEEIQSILMGKPFNISELTQEIKELREAIMYLPVIGSEYQKAEEEFEGNRKFGEDKVVEKGKE